MQTVLWVILVHVIEVIGIAGYLVVRKNNKLEKALVEQQQYIDAISIVIEDSANTIQELDNRGAFEADDEVGTFFRSLKEIQNVLNQFNTRKGQRVMNPKFGSIIWDLLMEPLTPMVTELLQKDISVICNSDPRVYPLNMKVNEYEQGYLIEITLAMKNTNQSSTLRLAFDQKLGIVVQ